MTPKLSIVLCSRDRAGPLARCLGALPAAAVRDAAAELVLVDNGSSDDTDSVAQEFAASAPFPVVLVPEPRPGLSRARNAGLRAASAPVIAFTDDDCVLDERWPRIAAATFDGRKFRYCGGRVLLGDPTDARYCYVDDERPREFAPGEVLVPGRIQGANMIIHRDVVDRIGGFDEMLGAGTPFRSEDIDYLARASIAGFAGAYRPELVVHHFHGRKPGPELEALKRSNDVACGAYSAKLVDLGHGEYRSLMTRALLRPWRWGRAARMWHGAREYRRAIRTAGVRPKLAVPLQP